MEGGEGGGKVSRKGGNEEEEGFDGGKKVTWNCR